MKRYSLTDKLPDRYPMTPPDDPPEPDLSKAFTCPKCFFKPDWECRLNGTEYRLLCTNHLSGFWRCDIDAAIEDWNSQVEEYEEYGERLKAEGQKQVAERNAEWMAEASRAIARFANAGIQFTSEDVRTYCGIFANFQQPKSHNAWGAAFSVAAKKGLIVRCGYAKNSLPSAHARVVAVWKGKA